MLVTLGVAFFSGVVFARFFVKCLAWACAHAIVDCVSSLACGGVTSTYSARFIRLGYITVGYVPITATVPTFETGIQTRGLVASVRTYRFV